MVAKINSFAASVLESECCLYLLFSVGNVSVFLSVTWGNKSAYLMGHYKN